MRINIPHRLSPVEATSRIKTLLTQVRSAHADKIEDLQEEWSVDGCSFSFTASGYSITGNIAVGKESVVVIGELPFLLGLFRGQIEDVIRENAAAILKSPVRMEATPHEPSTVESFPKPRPLQAQPPQVVTVAEEPDEFSEFLGDLLSLALGDISPLFETAEDRRRRIDQARRSEDRPRLRSHD